MYLSLLRCHRCLRRRPHLMGNTGQRVQQTWEPLSISNTLHLSLTPVSLATTSTVQGLWGSGSSETSETEEMRTTYAGPDTTGWLCLKIQLLTSPQYSSSLPCLIENKIYANQFYFILMPSTILLLLFVWVQKNYMKKEITFYIKA